MPVGVIEGGSYERKRGRARGKGQGRGREGVGGKAEGK